ncbi:hypothetical protein [Dysgonomonas mossii]|uniref:hypothetical protein n=1 Tax=Dysgonomonas mossii TaxID=163665 RepID=UPI00399189B0
MKTYILTLSKFFLKEHPKSGQKTDFIKKLKEGIKIHTIRGNYELWEKRIKEVQEGKAILSIRQWSEKPYRSKQEIIMQLTAKDGVSCQCLDCDKPFALEIDGKPLKYQPEMVQLANNDGLDYEDFDSWFDIDKTTGKKAIIHFTKFRY